MTEQELPPEDDDEVENTDVRNDPVIDPDTDDTPGEGGQD